VRSLRPTLLVALAVVALAGPAAASSGADAEERAIAEARTWRGRWCPPTGCGAPPPASFASIGGFAAATLGALALARRRSS
jgi:MYXO-CTERM domain-containing protein